MRALKVLVLMHPSCVPPEGATIKDADWADWKTEFYVLRALKSLGHQTVVYGVEDSIEKLQARIQEVSPDIIFNLLEEYQGEPRFESHVAAFLELLDIPYTGCNPQGLSIGRDKAMSKKILQYHNIPTAGFFTVPLGKSFEVPRNMTFPMIVKSLNEEASLGISQESVVSDSEKLKKRVDFIHENLGTPALVEEYVEGREFYVGVLGHKKLKVLPPWELSFGKMSEKKLKTIATRNVKFNKDYCERHGIRRGFAKNLTPLQLKQIENVSKKVYRALKLSGYARLDFRLTSKGELVFLEANPNPELARGECLANAALHSGLDYEALIGKILSLSLSYELAA